MPSYIHPLHEFELANPPRAVTSVQGGSGLTTLRNNSIYRMSDVVQQNAREWTELSIQILRDPAVYGKSILYDWLLRTTYDERGHPLHSTASKWHASRGPWVCSRLGRCCTLGEIINNTNDVAPPSSKQGIESSLPPEVATLFYDLNRTEPRSQPLLLFERNACMRVVELALAIKRRLMRGACVRAPQGTAAVHLRLGDKPDIYGRVSHDHFAPSVPISQQAVAFGCANVSVSVVAVINFDETGAFRFKDANMVRAEQYVAGLRSTLEKCTVGHTLRSLANVDDDLCFLATADYYLPSVGGLSNLMVNVRRAFWAIDAAGPGTSWDSAHQLINATNRQCAAWLPHETWSMRHLPTFTPPNSSCLRQQATCAAHNAGQTQIGPLWQLEALKHGGHRL